MYATLENGRKILVYFLTLCLSFFYALPSFAQVANARPFIMVLGIAQDAGYPQMGCDKECCKKVINNQSDSKLVASLALVDSLNNKFWLFDATPDIAEQVQVVNLYLKSPLNNMPSGVFLTHAHIGHYTGLMYFGREVLGAKKQKIYAMPKMNLFLKENGPWSQLIKLDNIEVEVIEEGTSVVINEKISVTALKVPHRDEFSETVGYVIESFEKKVLYIPDIDKWGKWHQDIKQWILKVDVAYLDGTFYQNGEIPGRDMSEIPHPFIAESMGLFEELPPEEKTKVRFIHLNHTNPLLRKDSKQFKEFKQKGFGLAKEREIFRL